jgi:two-component system chemotaxis response regulator CheB
MKIEVIKHAAKKISRQKCKYLMALPDQLSEEPRFIVVVGTSAGGLNALTEFVGQLDQTIDASIFVVMHLSRMGITDFLTHRLQKYSTLDCVVPTQGMKIQRAKIYIAPPDAHLMVKKGEIIIGHGAKENRWRPSIDVLFRSAAAAYDGRVIGVILTGLLDDGMAGMLAIKRCGGRTIVQNPNEAEYPNMPLAVLNNMEVDECISLSQMGETLRKFTKAEYVRSVPIPDDIKIEAEIAEDVLIGIDIVKTIGEQSFFTCPDCGGNLWKIKNGGMEHYRCHTGHSYTEHDLGSKQDESIEGTLWVAMRLLEERRKLLKTMEDKSILKGFIRLAQEHEFKVRELDSHIDKLKELLFAFQRVSSTSESA